MIIYDTECAIPFSNRNAEGYAGNARAPLRRECPNPMFPKMYDAKDCFTDEVYVAEQE